MAVFDAMSPEERRLANEYGVNVVRLYRGLGASDERLEAACMQHRNAKQMEVLAIRIDGKELIRKLTRKHVVRSLATNEVIDLHRRQIEAQAEAAADGIIRETDKHYAERPELLESIKPAAPRGMLGRLKEWLHHVA